MHDETERVSQRCQTKAKKAVKGETRNNKRTLAPIILNMPHIMLLRCTCTHRQHRPHTPARTDNGIYLFLGIAES